MTHNITLSIHHGVLYVSETYTERHYKQRRAVYAEVLWSGEFPSDVPDCLTPTSEECLCD